MPDDTCGRNLYVLSLTPGFSQVSMKRSRFNGFNTEAVETAKFRQRSQHRTEVRCY